MQVRSDIVLRYQEWEKMEDLTVNLGIFDRFVDIFILALSLGINADEVIDETEGAQLANPKNIPRNTIITNSEISERIEFLYQNAVLNSKKINFTDEIRMKLAFDDEYTVDGFRQWDFLIKFANYGMKQITDVMTGYDMLTIENIIDLVKNSIEIDILVDDQTIKL
jgi:hypothetical protein